jgi:Zn-dependent protease with chaperone function
VNAWRAVGLTATIGFAQIALSADIEESKDYLFSSRDARTLELAYTKGITSVSELPIEEGVVLVVATQTGASVSVKAVTEKEADGKRLAEIVSRALTAAIEEPKTVSWSNEDEGTVASASVSYSRMFSKSSSINVDVSALRKAFEAEGFRVVGFYRVSRYTLSETWSDGDYQSRGYRYFSLDREVPEGGSVSSIVSIGAMHWLLLAVFVGLPFIGTFSGLALAVRYAKRSTDPPKRKRQVYTRLVMYPTFGSIIVHFPIFMTLMMTGTLRPVAELWLGTPSLIPLFAPVLLFSLAPLLIMMRVASKIEQKLFEKPEIEPPGPKDVELERRMEEALKTPKWVRALFGLLIVLVFSFLALPSIVGEKEMGVVRYILPPLLFVVIVTFAVGQLVSLRRTRKTTTEETERLRSVFASVGGDANKVSVEGSQFSDLTVSGSASARGRVTVSARALEVLSDAELRVLMAHELAHIHMKHPQKRAALLLAVMIPAFVLFVFREPLSAFIDRQILTLAPFVLLGCLMIGAFTVLPSITRKCELLCDRWALERVRDPIAMLGLWKKMWSQAGGPEAMSDHLSTHPSLIKRFQHLRTNAIELGLSSPELESEIDAILSLVDQDS